MNKINEKELEKFNDSLEKAMEVLARNWKKAAGDCDETIFDVAIIRDKEDDNDPDNINCHRWYVHVNSTVRITDEERETVLNKTFYLDLED